MKSDEVKVTMKESPQRYTNPFLSDEENDKVNFWNNQELEHSIVEGNFTTNLEDEKFRTPLAPCNVRSEAFEKAKELYIDKNVMECELPKLIACYEESDFHVVKDICVDEGISHGGKILIDKEHHELFCNPVSVNGDEHDDMIEDDLGTQVLKHERLRSSPLEDCYMNSDFCFGTKEKADTHFLIPEATNDHRQMGKSNDAEIPGQISPQGKDCVEDATKECGTQAKVAIHSVTPNESKNVSEDDNEPSDCAPDELKLFVESNTVENTENCGPDNSIQTGEVKLDSSSNSLNNSSTEQVVSGLNQDQPLTSIVVLESSNNGVNDVDQQLSQVHSPVEEILERPLAGSEAEELGRSSQATNISNEIKMEENITSNFDTVKPETVSGPCGTENPELSIGTQSAPDHQDMALNQLQRGEGESSFSVAGPVSGLITYSGPIASSGSISLRSDSSNTSVRSFAFPILQTEWNSSPVRMAKADHRHSRKRQGWKQAFLCCRF